MNNTLTTPPPISKQATLSPTSSSFYPMPPSPKDQFLGNVSPLAMRERAQSASFQEELEAQHRKRGSTNSSRYKTELCRPFEENGTCKYGDKCQFAHGFHELRGLNRHPKYKTEFCRTYHTIGFCPYGPRCHFIHNDEEKRLAQANAGRSCSISSMDSSPSSPVIDIAPSPFSNSLTPPTSPGYGHGGDVFLFDESSHIPHTPLAVCGQTLSSMSSSIHENPFPSPSNSVEFSLLQLNSIHEESHVPIAALSADSSNGREMSFQPIHTKIDDHVVLTPSESSLSSSSSNPPSPTDSLEENRRRLPVFGFVN